MKKRNEVGTGNKAGPDIIQSNAANSSIRYLIDDNSAWADLILSKTALILATVIILAAVYSLAASSSNIIKKDEMEAIALELASNIDSVGSMHSDTTDVAKNYSFDTYTRRLLEYDRLNISITGEYVACTFADKGHTVHAVRPLSYRTLPFDPGKLRSLLSGKFAADGSIGQPVHTVFPYKDVTSFLAVAATEELRVNISEEVRIEKASIYVTDGSEVEKLEYVLVFQ